MAGLHQINNKAIKYVERNTKKKFYKKPTISYKRGDCNNTVKWKAGHITEAKVIIDKDMSKYPFNFLVPPVVVHELRENLGFQHGESVREAHKNANKLEQRFVRTKAKSKSSKDVYNCLSYLLGYSRSTKESYKG